MASRWELFPTILDGITSVYIMALASVAALVVGTGVGLLTVGGPEFIGIGYAIIGILLFPVLMFTSIVRFVVGCCLLRVIFRYWLNEDRRLERLYLMLALSALMVWGTVPLEDWHVGIWLALAFLGAGYAGLRVWPLVWYRRVQAQLDREAEQRLADRLAGARAVYPPESPAHQQADAEAERLLEFQVPPDSPPHARSG